MKTVIERLKKGDYFHLKNQMDFPNLNEKGKIISSEIGLRFIRKLYSTGTPNNVYQSEDIGCVTFNSNNMEISTYLFGKNLTFEIDYNEIIFIN